MKIIINASNIRWGGGVQATVSLINKLNKNSLYNYEYYIFLSNAFKEEINIKNFKDNFYFYFFQNSPASLKHRKKITTTLNKLENKIKPDIVYTVFGPSYWKPKSFHVEGFALGWITNPKSVVYNKISLSNRIKKRLENRYKTWFLKREADHFIVETNDVKNKLSVVLKIPKEKITVIGNTYNSYFDAESYEHFTIPPKGKNTFRLVTISHFYVHKNLTIIRQVIPLLLKDTRKYEFILTIDENNFSRYFSDFKENIINLGPVESKFCPYIYQQADALFLPTLLESFTASYPEAMKMKLPILTSNYSFAKDICGDAALYFDPLDPDDIAEKIKLVASNQHLRDKLIRNGQEILKTFETPETRARKTIELLEELIDTNKK